MPKYAVFNTVMCDGMGDFSHFTDIMQALKQNPAFHDVEFVCIVSFQERKNMALATKVRESLDMLGFPYVLSTEYNGHKKLCSSEKVKNLMADVDQAIVISNDFDHLLDLYRPYMKQGIPVKKIMEHEVGRGLGLSPHSEGIKLKQVPEIAASTAWDVIDQHNPEFVETLLTNSEARDIKDFEENNLLLPAYFNKNEDFSIFLHRLVTARSNFKDKDYAIYHSGSDLAHYLNYDENKKAFENTFADTSIEYIAIIKKGLDEPIIIEGNSGGGQKIIIYSGFYLDDPSFEALHQLSDISGVSGDNTFERCISMNILPFYWSTNPVSKKQTLHALCEIANNPDLNISKEARKSFNAFFDPACYEQYAAKMKSIIGGYDRLEFPKNFQDVDLSLMIKEWPIVCDYLKQHKNFYDQLEKIVLADLPKEAKPAAFKMSIEKSNNQIQQKMFKKELQLLKQEKQSNEPSVEIILPKSKTP